MSSIKIEKKDFRREFRSAETFLREMFQAAKILPDAPVDEFDCLIHRVLSALHHQAREKEIRKTIEAEISGHFGIPLEKKKMKKLAQEIYHHWNKGYICVRCKQPAQ